MANRAFSQVLVEIERRDVVDNDADRGDGEYNNCRKKKKVGDVVYRCESFREESIYNVTIFRMHLVRSHWSPVAVTEQQSYPC